MAYYGIPEIGIQDHMRSHDFHVRVIYDTNPTDRFPLQSGVRHGCLLPPLLFVMWMMKKATNQTDKGLP